MLFSAVCFPAEKPEMLYFYSKDCPECHHVKQEFLPGFLKKYGEIFKFTELEVFEDANVANLDSLVALEERLKIPEEDKNFPAVYFMGNMVEGEIPVMLRLESIVLAYVANPDSMLEIHKEVMSRVPEKIEKLKANVTKQVHMAYFYEEGCKKCGRALEIITWLEKNYKNIVIHKFDIEETQNKIIAVALGMRTGMPEDKFMSTPSFFVGNNYVLSSDVSRENLNILVNKYTQGGAKAVWESLNESDLKLAEGKIKSKFQSFTFFLIAGAGLADGVNPCAFATIIFFISYLTLTKRKGKEILWVGFAFALSIFITYFLVGLGFFKIMDSIVNIAFMAKIIFGGTAAICIVFGFLSISDYFKARAGNTSDMSLQLPAFLKKRIHSTIREKTRMKSIVAGALIAGFLVSIFELACTGQLYLPTIILMLQRSDTRTVAALFLLVYNLFFIVPLLIVFGVVYFGVSSKSLANVMEARVGLVKIVLAIVFFGVAALLLWTAF